MGMLDVKPAPLVTEVPAGTTAVLECRSNDFAHNFMFWLYNNSGVIAPGNTYDEKKYKFEMLSGKLLIHNVSPAEAGMYNCVSKKITGHGYSVGDVELIVSGSTVTAGDVIKIIAIVVSIIILIGCAIVYYRLKKEWKTIPAEEIEDEDVDGDEIYNRTTTPLNQPVPGPSRNQSSEHLIYGIDNQGLDTDFNSVFENIQIKSPQKNLI